MRKVLCLGELLWDMIPSGKVVGGAPFNVTYHLKKLGVQSIISTRVGQDKEGDELVDFVRKNEIDISLIQKDNKHATSLVKVVYDDREGIQYDIVESVAWDYLDEIVYPLGAEDYVVFGSLLFRHDVSRKTALSYLYKTPAIKVFDLNLRAPHFDKSTIFEILFLTDILKINEEELKILVSWLGDYEDIPKGVHYLLNEFNLKEVICTLGSEGAFFATSSSDTSYRINALNVDLVDTIGSGDSFLAGYLCGRIENRTIKESLTLAASLAGFVSSQKGGCPSYTIDDFKMFQWRHPTL